MQMGRAMAGLAVVVSMVWVSQAVAKEKAASPAQQSASQAQKEQQAKEVQARLNGSQWDIELAPMSGEKGKNPAKDTLVFEKGKMQSKQLAGSGFPATNYTLTVGDDGIAVWETMQTGQDTSVVFWRGELHGDAMRGILSKHPAKGNSVDMAFSGQYSGAAAAGSIAEPAAEKVETKTETKAESKAEVKPAQTKPAPAKATKKKEDKKTR